MARREVDKRKVMARLIEDVAADLATAVDSQKSTHEGAVHEEARPEDDKDTRALEQSYLARGLARRVEELQDTLAELESLVIRRFKEADPIGVSALVTVEDEDGKTSRYLLAPAGGGLRVSLNRVEIIVVTPASPLGRALIGKSAGDEVSIRSPKGERFLEIVGVS